jgi:hypothetical protein
MEIKFEWFGQLDNEDKPRRHEVVGIHFGADVVEVEDDYGSTYTINNGLRLFTGQQDKHGLDLYDRDIVKEGGLIGVLEWDNRYSNFICRSRTGTAGMYLQQMEKIGNLDENPELLGTK